MVVSFQTTGLKDVKTFKQNKKSIAMSSEKYPTPESIERNKRIKKDNALTMVVGTGIGAAIGCFKFPNKLKAGIIGGLIGLVAGKVVGFLTHPYEIRDKR